MWNFYDNLSRLLVKAYQEEKNSLHAFCSQKFRYLSWNKHDGNDTFEISLYLFSFATLELFSLLSAIRFSIVLLSHTMSNKIFTLVSIKVVILVGVVRPWPYENITNHHQHNANSRSYLNSMMMMNDLCELPLDQLLKVKKSLRDLQLSTSSDADVVALQSRKGNAAATQSRSIVDENLGYNKVNYDSNSIATNTDQQQQQQPPPINRFAVWILKLWQSMQIELYAKNLISWWTHIISIEKLAMEARHRILQRNQQRFSHFSTSASLR